MTSKAISSRARMQAEPRRVLFAREPGWQFSLMLALEVFFVFGALPALSAGRVDRGVSNLLQLALAGTAIALIAKSTWLRLCLATSFGLTLLARYLPGLLPHTTTLAMIFLYNVLVTGATARAVFGPGDVNHHRIAGAVFVYLNVALLFALAYTGMLLAIPDAITGLSDVTETHMSNLIHFSFATLTSIGDNTLKANSAITRSLSDLETIVGQLFPAILLSRLVGLHLSRSR